MRAPLSWLREYVDLPADVTPADLAARLTALGLKLEALEAVGSDIEGPLVVGRVLTFDDEPQKNGKVIRWCRVDVGPEHNDQDGGRGIVCGADEIAIGIMEHALSIGLRIPEDLAVVGSDGLPHSRSELVGLTTIVQPVQEMANNAFSLLLDQITHPRNTFTHILCEHRLHLGRTCGCPPGATRNT